MKRLKLNCLSIVGAVLLISCHDDVEKEVGPVVVQFQATELVIAENAVSKPIILQLSGMAIHDGEVIIKLSSLSDKVGLKPAPTQDLLHLPVSKGDEFVSFEISPIDNQIIDGDTDVTFTVESAPEGFLVGSTKSVKAIIVDDEIPVTAGFQQESIKAIENNGDGTAVIVTLSGNAPGEGTLLFSFQSDHLVYGTHFTTEPALINGKLSLQVPVSAAQVSFKVYPVDDVLFNGDRSVAVKLESAEGAVSKGSEDRRDITIADDELATKTKGYSISAGAWSLSRAYSYNEDGTLATINWKKYTPALSEGIIQYEYDDHGKVIKVIDNSVDETFYIWTENRIVKEERYREGALKQYTVYGYDVAGNVAEVTVHYRQPDGSFPLSLMFVYLYHTDGNVYKRLAYSPIPGSEEFNLLSTQTYEHYLDVENPFSMVEILPNVHSQPQLPLSFRVEEGGKDILYQFTYEFDSKGRPTKRLASSAVGSEAAQYQYYQK